MKKNLFELLIEYQEVNTRLDKIRNDPDYINNKVKEIWKDKPQRDHSKEIEAITNSL